MKHDPARNPSTQSRASAHRAMALAALRSDSSLSVRLRRYNQHMAKVRALEASERTSSTTRDPFAALAWFKAGKPVRIEAVDLADWLRHVRALAAADAQGGAQ